MSFYHIYLLSLLDGLRMHKKNMHKHTITFFLFLFLKYTSNQIKGMKVLLTVIQKISQILLIIVRFFAFFFLMPAGNFACLMEIIKTRRGIYSLISFYTNQPVVVYISVVLS